LHSAGVKRKDDTMRVAPLTAFARRCAAHRWTRRGLAAAALLAALAVAGWLALIAAAARMPIDLSRLTSGDVSSHLFDRHGRPLRAYLGNDERWRIPVTLDEVSPWLVKATLAVEDERFFHHGGIDPLAVARAALTNIARARIVSGASTISMQVAMLGEPRTRSLGWKLRQAFRALQVERRLTKRQILELYFTNAPYGGNVCGAEAAARRYFAKSARDLTLAEAALLAGVPQSPSRLRPDRHPAAALRRQRVVLDRMLQTGAITREERDRALAAKPAVGAYDALNEAPHFCDYVHYLYPRETRLTTTLDLAIQREAERMLRARVAALRPQGVTNGAVVIVDNATGDVLAMVGSADYSSQSDAGQVNGALAVRSPGSALKPLIYALCFDQRVLLPATILCDVPVNFRGYDPENFDQTYQGLVRADKALAWSLNIPAIEALRCAGLGPTLRLLRQCGIKTLRQPPDDYGLSLAIGTCGVRLADLTNAYAVLARGGTYRPWRVSARCPTPAPERVLSPGACYFVCAALSDSHLRPPESVAAGLAGLQGVAWKTGTSSGFRDAWTVACDANHTVGVWIGNFDGRPSRALVGAQAAAPVALGLIRMLRGRQAAAWPRPTADVTTAVVCAETGLAPNADCPTTKTVEALAATGSASLPVCTVHRRIWIDRVTGHELCTRCMAGREPESRVMAIWPPQAAAWLAHNSRTFAPRPPHLAECPGAARNAGPRIVRPRPGDNFVLTGERSLEAQKVALEATAPPPTGRLYWFLNGELVATAEPRQTAFLVPRPGTHSLRCADDFGRADWVTFTVEPARP
jgi:penicillin-binding protein 1C